MNTETVARSVEGQLDQFQEFNFPVPSIDTLKQTVSDQLQKLEPQEGETTPTTTDLNTKDVKCLTSLQKEKLLYIFLIFLAALALAGAIVGTIYLANKGSALNDAAEPYMKGTVMVTPYPGMGHIVGATFLGLFGVGLSTGGVVGSIIQTADNFQRKDIEKPDDREKISTEILSIRTIKDLSSKLSEITLKVSGRLVGVHYEKFLEKLLLVESDPVKQMQYRKVFCLVSIWNTSFQTLKSKIYEDSRKAISDFEEAQRGKSNLERDIFVKAKDIKLCEAVAARSNAATGETNRSQQIEGEILEMQRIYESKGREFSKATNAKVEQFKEYVRTETEKRRAEFDEFLQQQLVSVVGESPGEEVSG